MRDRKVEREKEVRAIENGKSAWRRKEKKD